MLRNEKEEIASMEGAAMEQMAFERATPSSFLTGSFEKFSFDEQNSEDLHLSICLGLEYNQ
jgi:hypothetical protein